MIKSGVMAWKAVFAAAGLALLGGATFAADAGPKIGIIDVEKLYNDAPRVKQYREGLVKLRTELGTKLEIRSQNRMLSEEQVKEFVDLKLKTKPTEQDTKRIKELTDLEHANDEELKKLQTTAQPTEQQKARLKELTDMQQKSTSIGQQMEKDYNAQLDSKTQELDAKVESEVREAINKVAQEKSYAYVLAKAAVFVGGTDITDDVIGKLERKAE